MGEITEQKPSEFKFEGDRWELPTKMESIAAAGEEMERRLLELSWSEDEIMDVRIALSDLLANAIGHGNLNIQHVLEGKMLSEMIAEKLHIESCDKKVVLEHLLSPSRAEITIEDEGDGFDYEKIEAPLQGAQLTETHGRGVYILNHLPGVTIRYEGKGNRVVLTKERSLEADGAGK